MVWTFHDYLFTFVDLVVIDIIYATLKIMMMMTMTKFITYIIQQLHWNAISVINHIPSQPIFTQ